jgi:hypothetical protein
MVGYRWVCAFFVKKLRRDHIAVSIFSNMRSACADSKGPEGWAKDLKRIFAKHLEKSIGERKRA